MNCRTRSLLVAHPLSTPSDEQQLAKPITGPISMILSLVHTTVDSTQVRHVNDPENVDRSIFAKPRGIKWTDFDLSPEQQQYLYDSGYAAGRTWLDEHPEGPKPVKP
ncbi:MAG: hypothetical protein ABIN55_02770 [Aeromicrobium sp.]